MAGKVDIVALGELLIDFTEAGFSVQTDRNYLNRIPGEHPPTFLR